VKQEVGMEVMAAKTDFLSDIYMKCQSQLENNLAVSTGSESSVATGDASASPKEGAALIRAFLRVKKREVRAAIIELTENLSR
jgi:hypothetical protein